MKPISQQRRGRAAPRRPQPYCEVHGACHEKATVWFKGMTLFGEPVVVWACSEHQLEFRLRHPEMSWGESKF